MTTKVVSCRVPERFAELIKKFCQLEAHVNPADFIRDAMREKIKRDAPHLYTELFQAEKEEAFQE